MKRIFQSLRARLTFWVLLLSVAIFGSIAAVFHFYSFDREERSAIKYTHAKLDNMALNIDLKVKAVEHSVKQAAPMIERHLQEPQVIADIVEQVVKKDTLITGGSIAFEPDFYPEKGRWFMEYVLIDSTDSTITHKQLGGEKYDYLNMQWYKSALTHSEGVWSEPYFDEGGGQTYMVTYSFPLKDKQGNTFAVMTADVTLDNLVNAIHSLQLYDDSRIFMSTKQGTFITHWRSDMVCNATVDQFADSIGSKDAHRIAREIKAGHSGTMKLEMKGHDAMALYTVVPDVGWRLCAFCTYKSIMGELLGTSLTIIGIFLLGLAMLSLCIALILRHEMRPLEYLARAARKIGRGDFNVELPSIDGNDELRQLHDSFASMQLSLTDYVKELQTITASKQRIESELHIAHVLQMSLLPNIFPPFPDRNDLDIYASLTPAKEVGGDLYDFFIRGEKLFFAVGDVSGKGIPASLFMAITRSLFRMTANRVDSPALTALLLNNAIADNNDTNMFVTMFIGALDLKTGVLTFCNAGHNPPLLMPANGDCSYMDVEANLPIGVMKGFEYKEQTIEIGSCGLLVYTDGVTEAESPSGTLFGEERLIELCKNISGKPSKDVIESITAAVKQHADTAQQSDDITLLHIKSDITNKLRITNNLSEMEQLPPFMEALGAKHNIDTATVSSLNLAVEESMVNAISYAYPKGETGEITLKANYDDASGTMTFTLTDHGQPFDPTQVPEADVTLSAEQRQIGGLGIFLVRQLMDTVEYHRDNDSNILIMKKKI